MRKSQLFVTAELATLLALLAVAVAMGVLGATDSVFHSGSLQDPIDAAKMWFLSTLFFGIFPASAVGAPIYFALLLNGNARWPYVALLGVSPGIAILPFDTLLGMFSIVCGFIVASLTHIGCRGLGPNNSFKPKLLRSGNGVAG